MLCSSIFQTDCHRLATVPAGTCMRTWLHQPAVCRPDPDASRRVVVSTHRRTEWASVTAWFDSSRASLGLNNQKIANLRHGIQVGLGFKKSNKIAKAYPNGEDISKRLAITGDGTTLTTPVSHKDGQYKNTTSPLSNGTCESCGSRPCCVKKECSARVQKLQIRLEGFKLNTSNEEPSDCGLQEQLSVRVVHWQPAF